MKAKGQKAVDEKLLLALVCGATNEAAARSAGVSDRTIYRRLKDPAFKSRLKQMRAEILQRVSGTLVAASTEASKTLLALMKPEATDSVRLGAARTVLEFALKIREAAELEARLTTLETLLNEGK